MEGYKQVVQHLGPILVQMDELKQLVHNLTTSHPELQNSGAPASCIQRFEKKCLDDGGWMHDRDCRIKELENELSTVKKQNRDLNEKLEQLNSNRLREIGVKAALAKRLELLILENSSLRQRKDKFDRIKEVYVSEKEILEPIEDVEELNLQRLQEIEVKTVLAKRVEVLIRQNSTLREEKKKLEKGYETELIERQARQLNEKLEELNAHQSSDVEVKAALAKRLEALLLENSSLRDQMKKLEQENEDLMGKRILWGK